MRRITAFVLSLLMICTLTSCSRGKTDEKKKSEETDLSQLDGEFLYRHGEEKMSALKSALYTTKIFSVGEELGEFETVRIRRGYDGFIYSRRGQGFYCFDGERAYTQNRSGAFTAPCTIRVFEEYLNKFVFSVCALNPDLLENFERDGDTVSYESTKEELLSLYRLAEKPDFVPLSLTGVARLDKEGVILEESIVLKGEKEEYELQTVLTSYRKDSIAIATPDSTEEFSEVADIRLPLRLQSAIDTLFEQKEVQTTAVATGSMDLGGAKYLITEDINTYAKAEAGEYYVSRQSLKQIPELPEESIFYQALLSKGQKTENRYNVILGEKLWENSEAATSLSWGDEIRDLIPSLSEFETFTMTEEVGGYSVSFTLTDEAAKKIAKRIAASFSENVSDVQAATVRFSEGTLSIDNTSEMLTAISYKVEGSLATAAGSGEYTGRYSVLVDCTEGVILPELQAPTPTTPGMVDHSVPIPEC